MKFLLLLCLIMGPLRQVETIQLELTTPDGELFSNYTNDNFSQHIFHGQDQTYVDTSSLNFYDLDLNFRVMRNEDYIRRLEQPLQDVVNLLLLESNLKKYLENISGFLKSQILYGDNVPQDAFSVIRNKKANCVGYSNLVNVFLSSAGIQSRFVNGFYLKKIGRRLWEPIPHKWLEILLNNGSRFFYDPQYQTFSSNYLFVNKSVDFRQIRRFSVYLRKREKKFLN